jgi:hypothetical protein
VGPACPCCGAIYEWTEGEIDEDVMFPKIYFCQKCRHMFVLSAEEITKIQVQCKPALEHLEPKWDDGLHDE